MVSQSLPVQPTTHATVGLSPDRLTIFAFLWACQALVHQEFYSGWLHQRDPRGWVLTAFALATLTRPSSLLLFGGMLLSSIVYNVAKWPFVVNHILLESLINATILAAVVMTSRRQRYGDPDREPFRDRLFDAFAPVVCVMLVCMYWFAFLAKLNLDFLNPEVSCVSAMFGDLRERLPFLPDTITTHQIAIALTLLVEGLIPLLLTFRRTRPFAVLIGLPFHLMLGLIGHRTFSALAYALYALITVNVLQRLVVNIKRWLQQRYTTEQLRIGRVALTVAVVSVVVLLLVADLAGQFRTRIVGLAIYQIPWLIWISWSLAVGGVCTFGIVQQFRQQPAFYQAPLPNSSSWLWLSVPLVVLVGLSPYLGLKTETCFSMYSNLRTEAGWNNHLFMPAFKLGPWQTDLATIVATDHPDLQKYVERGDLITYFELRRAIDRTSRELEYRVEYLRDGELHVITQSSAGRLQTDGGDPHPELLGRLLYFRPVPSTVCMPCRH